MFQTKNVVPRISGTKGWRTAKKTPSHFFLLLPPAYLSAGYGACPFARASHSSRLKTQDSRQQEYISPQTQRAHTCTWAAVKAWTTRRLEEHKTSRIGQWPRYVANLRRSWSVDLYRTASLPVGSPWHSGLSCALDVGRELSRLHSLDGAEANSMLKLS